MTLHSRNLLKLNPDDDLIKLSLSSSLIMEGNYGEALQLASSIAQDASHDNGVIVDATKELALTELIDGLQRVKRGLRGNSDQTETIRFALSQFETGITEL